MLESNHEEADASIILHAQDARNNGYERTVIISNDTDVLVLLVHFLECLSKEVWMKIRTSHQEKYIPVHKISLPQPLASNLPAFHALTGCDTVSQFLGISKSSAWKVYQTNWFYLDGLGKEPLSEDTLRDVEKFVCKLYSPATTVDSIDQYTISYSSKEKKRVQSICRLPPMLYIFTSGELTIKR